MNQTSMSASPLKVTLATDVRFENARRFKSYDDFEELPFHATILIDKEGRVHWGQHGRRAVHGLQVPAFAAAEDE
jgi:hypothetical protein